jgi:uncharacterized integral membrane protein
MISESTVYQGQFGSFTVTKNERVGVILYRVGLVVMAICLSASTTLVLKLPQSSDFWLTCLYYLFILALGLSLFQIHIYLAPLHRALKLSWLIGTISSMVLSFRSSFSLVRYVYENPLSLLAVGFVFVALTGIYFKEAFCFNRLESKILTPLVPFLLLGHLAGIFSSTTEKLLLVIWSALFIVFVIRKTSAPLDPDLGDLSVFAYLHQQKS